MKLWRNGKIALCLIMLLTAGIGRSYVFDRPTLSPILITKAQRDVTGIKIESIVMQSELESETNGKKSEFTSRVKSVQQEVELSAGFRKPNSQLTYLMAIYHTTWDIEDTGREHTGFSNTIEPTLIYALDKYFKVAVNLRQTGFQNKIEKGDLTTKSHRFASVGAVYNDLNFSVACKASGRLDQEVPDERTEENYFTIGATYNLSTTITLGGHISRRYLHDIDPIKKNVNVGTITLEAIPTERLMIEGMFQNKPNSALGRDLTDVRTVGYHTILLGSDYRLRDKATLGGYIASKTTEASTVIQEIKSETTTIALRMGYIF